MDQQPMATTARPSVGTRTAVIALIVALGVSLGWALNSTLHHHASRLPRHEVVGVVSRVDADGLCIAPDNGSSIQCGSTLLFGAHPPVGVGDHVDAHFSNFPADQPNSNGGLVSVSLWVDVTPIRS
jgi:hypothetical protein